MDLNTTAQLITAVIGGLSLILAIIIFIISREKDLHVIMNDIKWLKEEFNEMHEEIKELRNKFFLTNNKKKRIENEELK